MTALFESVLRISAEAAVLSLLALGARFVVGRRPGAMLAVLYMLIAVRLAVPFAIHSPLSVYNIVPRPEIAMVSDSMADPGAAGAALEDASDYGAADNASASTAANTAPGTASAPDAPKASPLTASDAAALLWAAGMLVFSGVMLTDNARLRRRLLRNRDYDAPGFAALLNECRQTLGLKKPVRAVCASETGTAAVYGVFRPLLLISPASFETLTTAQQRYVLLHELSHIRRRDTLACAAATALNIVHWFNPLVWLVFALMRRDIEVLCDAHVFRSLPGSERGDYARTLLQLAGPVQTPKLAPALFISKANVKRRIVMVLKNRTKSALFTAVALLLTTAVAVTGCTAAMEQAAEPEAVEASYTISSAPAEASYTVSSAPIPSPTPQPAATPVLMAAFTIDDALSRRNWCSANVQKAAELLGGTVIRPGETLSLNAVLGPRTVGAGWQEGAGIEDGVYMVSADGGVCIVATALYNAAIRAELDITEATHPSVPADYVDAGLDATISTNGPDLKLTNPYDSDVTIEAALEGSLLTVSVYGPARDHTVDFSSERQAGTETPETVYHYNTTEAPDGTKLAKGTTYVYRRPRAGVVAQVYKTTYDADGQLIQRELFAKVTYRSYSGIYYVNGPEP